MDLRGKTQGLVTQVAGPQDRDKSAGPSAIFGCCAPECRERSGAPGECARANRPRREQRSRPIQGSTGLPAHRGVFCTSQTVGNPRKSRAFCSPLGMMAPVSSRLALLLRWPCGHRHFRPAVGILCRGNQPSKRFLAPARSAIHAAKAASFSSALQEPSCSSPKPAIICFVSVGDLPSAADAVM